MNFTLRVMCVCVFVYALKNFSFCGATAQIGPRTPHFEVSLSQTVTTHSLAALLQTSGHLVAEAAT